MLMRQMGATTPTADEMDAATARQYYCWGCDVDKVKTDCCEIVTDDKAWPAAEFDDRLWCGMADGS